MNPVGQETKVILLVCPHTPHTSQVRIECKPPKVVFSGCDECAKKFFHGCIEIGGEAVKPKMLM